MRILVTGANGFVGSHVTETLLNSGHAVRCFVRKTSDLKWLKGLPVEFSYGDVNAPETLLPALSGVEIVVHCAGLLRARDVKRYYYVNQLGTRNLTAACNGSGVKKIIYISSLAAYGPSLSGAARRFADEPQPVSDYGRSKLAGEQEIKKNARIPWTIIVPSAVYGPRDKDMFAFFKIVKSGFSIRTKKARSVNLTYVGDIAESVRRCVEKQLTSYRTYYIAEKKIYTWSEICAVLSGVMGRKTVDLVLPEFLIRVAAFFSEKIGAIFGRDAVFNTQKADEMLQERWILDDKLAEDDLGMVFTDFVSGAKKTYNWYKENGWL